MFRCPVHSLKPPLDIEKIIVSVSFNLVEDELIEANKDKDIVIAKLSEQIRLLIIRQLARETNK
jgi:hypothetical protein